MFNPKQVKNDFPIFYHNPSLVYLDSTATSLKPIKVIEKEIEYYKKYSANIYRGIYKLAEKATEEYEESRKIVALFLGTKNPKEIIFTRNATESINLIATTLGEEITNQGDEIVTTVMEHHSNFVPWQHLSFRTGGVFKVIDIDENYELGITNYELREHKNKRSLNQKNITNINLKNVITKKTKILAVALVSNTLGTINPVKEIIREAKKINPNVITVVDAAQGVPHMKVNVADLGCDFLVCSSHKMLGPTGVGVLWGKYELLEQMSPYQFGGEMISQVKIEETTWNEVPHKFEAGTPHIAGVIALKEAVGYLQYYGLDEIHKHEQKLAYYAMNQLEKEFGEKISIIGPKKEYNRAGIISFTFGKYHPHDIAQILDEEHIAVRAGHHCTMPLHNRLNLPATTRASFYLYNTEEDVDKLMKGLKKVEKILDKRL